jgi:hypothetical protein
LNIYREKKKIQIEERKSLGVFYELNYKLSLLHIVVMHVPPVGCEQRFKLQLAVLRQQTPPQQT